MRMKVRTTTLTTVVVMILAIATAALGAKPDNPGKPGGGGGAEHPDGATCAEQSGVLWAAEEDGFTVTFTADDPKTACIDWKTITASEWKVTVDGADARDFYFNIRDSHPGDFCWLGGLDRQELRAGVTTLVASHSKGELANLQNPGPIPASTINACGFEYTDDDPQLVFTIIYKGKAPVTVTVAPLPQPESWLVGSR